MPDTIKCTCKSEFQDKFYGKQMRLVNRSLKENIARCTVCGSKARWIERVRLNWQSPATPDLKPFLLPPMNPRLCTENRMVKS